MTPHFSKMNGHFGVFNGHFSKMSGHFGILIGNAKIPFQKTQFIPPPAVNKNNYFPKFLSMLVLIISMLYQCDG